MRFDTQNAGHFLVWRLQQCRNIAHVLEDGSDIILLKLVSGQQILLYLIDSPIGLSEIRATLRQNSQNSIFSLYIFWCDLLLPPENSFYELDDWMAFLVALYGDKLYGFDVQGRNTFFFPVHFQGAGKRRYINFGEDVDFDLLTCVTVTYGQTNWLVAGFTHSQEDQVKRRVYHESRLAPYFAMLGLELDADLPAIKSAYRRLAQRLHPDVNPDLDATERMKQVNDAYAQIIKALGQE